MTVHKLLTNAQTQWSRQCEVAGTNYRPIYSLESLDENIGLWTNLSLKLSS